MLTTQIELLWMLAVGTLVFLGLITVIIISMIVSHRRQIEAQRGKLEALQKSDRVLRESEKKYRTLVESMDDFVFVADKDGKLLFVNSRLAQLFQIVYDKILGKTLYDLFPGETATRIMNSLNQVSAIGKAMKNEYSFEIGGQNYWLETTFVPQYDRKRNIVSVLGISRDTTERRKMEEQLKELVATLQSQQETLKALSSEIIRAQEAERKRISREVHDQVGQALTAIGLNLGMIKQQIKDKDELALRVRECSELVKKTMKDIHRFSYELLPSSIEDLGLLPAIRSQIRSFQGRTGIKVDINETKSVEKIDSEVKTVLYRVIQEGLNNITKHSDAHFVRIKINKRGGLISLHITDDGKGFETGKLPKLGPGKGGLGLEGIRERVRLVGGNLSLISTPGSGTKLLVDIPYGEA